MSQPYNHRAIEKKWQEQWDEKATFKVVEEKNRKKSYLLVEFPYPSAEGLHVGHPRSYTAMDVLARKRRAQGELVLFPMGFDSFGLPAENYAIKTGQHPAVITKKNIENFRRQLKSLGYSFDWSREVITSDPSYYRWTQWIFLKLYERGLAYKAKKAINWCPSCKIGLAHEEVINGKCERCGTEVLQREKEQWMLKITAYADRLLDDLDTVDYSSRIKIQQQNWIGRSVGTQFSFRLRGVTGQEDDKHEVRVFTTRLDTLYGVTFIVVSPEVASFWMDIGWQARDEVRDYVSKSLAKRELERTEAKDKTGVDAGIRAVHPLTGEELPVWVADYVLGAYGTGAIMAVPAHDERDAAFAEKFHLPVRRVLVSDAAAGLWTGESVLENSDKFTGMTSADARRAIATKIGAEEKTQYKLRDWVFSRQRYWGEPIPMILCQGCGWVAVPEAQLPVELPNVERYQPTDSGESPLAAITDWVQTICPTCGGSAERETDTMPNWAGSSWYFLRYADPKNTTELAALDKLAYWTPVDWYNGGMEHTTLHLLYSRFWHKFLYDLGLVPTAEPYAKRTSHGMILAEDGQKMSKSRGNVVNPDEVVDAFGADTLRVYEMFMGPFEDAIPWSTKSMGGVRRFLERVWKFGQQLQDRSVGSGEAQTTILRHETAQAVKKVTDDIEQFRFNTALSGIMEFLNAFTEQKTSSRDELIEPFKTLLVLLQPFAPHVTAELWQQIGSAGFIWEAPWPTYDEADLVTDEVTVAVQVNGKLRGTIIIGRELDEQALLTAAMAHPNVSVWLSGKAIRKTIVRPGALVNFVLE
ncbi:MAG: leucine--tRNA ligase [Patescibacteria group bacterium]